MSMHLVGPYLTTTRVRKPEFKMTKAKRELLTLDWMEHNRQLKRQGLPKISFEHYLDERRGIVPKIKPEKVKQDYTKPAYYIPPGRETVRHPSLNAGVGNAFKAPDKVYTGDAMLGIGQLHKSNMVPVFKREDAEAIAKMRRG